MQTQQIINAPVGAYFFGAAGTAAAEKTTDATFEKLFQASSEKYETVSAEESKRAIEESKVSFEVSDEKSLSEDVVTGNQTEKSSKSVQEADQSDSVDEKELAERVAEVVAQATQIVKDVLNMSSEQLEEAMKLLGITEVDLLNADVLKQVVLTVNGEQDATAFLMDNDLLTKMQQLLDEIDALLEETGVDMATFLELFKDADFKELLENAMKEQSDMESGNAVTESDAENPAETVFVKETEIMFRAEASETKTNVSGNAAQSHENGDGTELLQEDAGLANQFVQNLQNAVAEGVGETTLGSDLATQIREIADQILEQVKVVVAPEMTSLEIQLTPEHLGKVNITVTEQDGVMKASFVTENELAKEAIESNLIQFKQMMNEQGIRVESVEVTVSEFAFDKNSEANQSGQEDKKHGKAHFVMEEETNNSVAMQDELALHFMEGGESTVNYMA